MTCTSSPWGANCAPEKVHPGWFFRSAIEVNGMTEMMNAVAAGNALYYRFTVPSAFMSMSYNVPQSQHADYIADMPCTSGDTVGGHAVTLIGYGVSGGTNYWQLQNSWGSGWFDRGYFKAIRGVNWCDSENYAYVFQAWVEGAREPDCFDLENTGLWWGPTTPMPCTE